MTKFEYKSRYKKNVHYPNVAKKVVEVDPFSVIPSIAVLSSGKCQDTRLAHNNGVDTPIFNDPTDVTNYAARYKARMEKIIAAKNAMSASGTASNNTPENVPDEPKKE